MAADSVGRTGVVLIPIAAPAGHSQYVADLGDGSDQVKIYFRQKQPPGIATARLVNMPNAWLHALSIRVGSQPPCILR